MNLRESKRPQEWPKAGLYWLLHHDTPIEWTDNIDERWDYVCKHKPKEELPVRLKWMRPVKGQLPKALDDAYKAYFDARKACNDAWKAYNDACKAYFEARKAYNDARKALDDARKAYDDACKAYDDACKAYEPEIDALMTKELPGCPWDGRSLT